MNKNFLRVIFIIIAIVIGLSNCGCNLWTAFVSGCVGYTLADFSYWVDGKF